MLDLAGPQDAPDVVVLGEAVGRPKAMTGEWLHRVLADHEDRAGLRAGVTEQRVERGVAEPIELEVAREDLAEVAHRGLDRVAAGERVDQPVEGRGAVAHLVIRVGREHERSGSQPLQS